MTNQVRNAASTSTVIQQQITSSNYFDGTFPTGDSPVDASNAMYKYTAQTAGGLFYWDTREPMIISQIHIDTGGTGDVTISLVNLNPASVVAGSPTVLSGETMIIEQQTAARFIALDEARFKTVLLPFQAIQIVTTASGAAQIAQVVGSFERTFIR